MPNSFSLSFQPIVSVTTGGRVTIPADPIAPEIPRNFTPKPEDRYVSFVLEVKGDVSKTIIETLSFKINELICTKLSGYFPELLFYRQKIWNLHKQWLTKRKIPVFFIQKPVINRLFADIKKRKYPRLQFKLEQLYPGSENDYKNAKKFGLHKFLLLTIPVYERQFKRRTTNTRFQATMFEIAYILRELNLIQEVNPCTKFEKYQLLSTMSGPENNLPKNWMLTNTSANNLQGINGSGITIGHPDSGWTPHPQLNFINISTNPTSPNFNLSRDWNVLNDANTAEEWLSSPAINHFHGTSTASVIVSSNDNQLTGIAPHATILPVRTVSEIDTGVVLIGDIDVARAIWYLINQNVDIISISLGGYPIPALECVVAHAVYNNTIVVAAAGQYWPFLVFPAGYPECIAVGASNNNNQPWNLCVKHSKIAISAPGEQVWSAYWDDSTPNRRAIVDGKGNGCSFAVAFVAGAASLWLQNYSKQTLINGLDGRATLQELFLSHLQRTATVPRNWRTNESGAGILNVQNLLDRTTLPDLQAFRGREWNNWRRRTTMELLYTQFENSDPVVVRERLGDLLNSANPEDLIKAWGQEILNAFMAVENAMEDFKEATEKTAEEAKEIIEDTVDKVGDVVSDTVSAVVNFFT